MLRTDADLAAATLSGDREAFAELVRRYEAAVRAQTLSVLRNHHSAQDAAQDAFVLAYERLADLRDGSAFGGWLLRIARTRALDVARRRQVGPLPEGDGLPSPAGRNGQLDETSHRLLEAIDRLPDHERLVVMLAYFDGRKVKDIADMTGRPISTVTVQLSRARARLREMLKEFEP